MNPQPIKTIVLDLLQQGQRDKTTFAAQLSKAERDEIGTWEHWSAKDHLAHRVFWHRDLINKLRAITAQQALPNQSTDEEHLNAATFEKYQRMPWPEVYAESEQTHAELIAVVEQLSEADLLDTKRFHTLSGDQPLYTAFLGGCYEHDQEHLAQYYVDHNKQQQAIHIREACAEYILQTSLPEWVKGWFYYNLACFYAQQQQLGQAKATLEKALTLFPALRERSEQDPDLAALHDQSNTAG